MVVALVTNSCWVIPMKLANFLTAAASFFLAEAAIIPVAGTHAYHLAALEIAFEVWVIRCCQHIWHASSDQNLWLLLHHLRLWRHHVALVWIFWLTHARMPHPRLHHCLRFRGIHLLLLCHHGLAKQWL